MDSRLRDDAETRASEDVEGPGERERRLVLPMSEPSKGRLGLRGLVREL